MRFRGRFVALGCLAMAACAAPKPEPTPPPPVARPAPTPSPTPTPVATHATWMDAPATPGDWHYRSGGDTTRALFGDAGADARFAVTCNLAQRTINLSRAGTLPASAPMVIRTEFTDRRLNAAPSTGALPSLDVSLSANDPLLDAMAFSKGRFAVEIAGLTPLYLPSWPEITRVIEDCRR